ncbi:MAG: 50S ribosomal protein L10 [Nitrospinaceae bacterium]|nr:MAG: 50S ribosomal protein L10 [Nitrospinaceae bacterium]
MANPAKQEAVKELNALFQKASAGVLADYQGIDAPSIAALRSNMRGRAVEFRVIKNTLAKLAAKNTPFEALDSNFKGPISVLLSFDDPVAPAKALADCRKADAKKTPKVICGLVDGKLISADEVKALADLPSREELLSQMLSVFQGPTTSFAGVFSSLLRKLVGTLDAVREKKAAG